MEYVILTNKGKTCSDVWPFELINWMLPELKDLENVMSSHSHYAADVTHKEERK